MSAATRRVAFWSIPVIGIVAVLVFTLRPQPVPVDLVAVQRGPFQVTVNEEAKTRVIERYVVSAPVTGTLLRIGLEVGDAVKAERTIVAHIEPRDPGILDTRERAEAQAELAGAEAARALARAGLEQAIAEQEFAAAEVSRARKLAVSGTISARAVDDAERTFKSRNAAVGTARSALQVAEHDLERARARLRSPINDPSYLDEGVALLAPIDGRVLQLFHKSSGLVQAGAPLVELGDPANLEIVAEMLSTEAVKVKAGQRVIIEGWGGDHPLAGKIRLVEPFGFVKHSALGIEEQRVNVIVDFDGEGSAHAALGHGYRVEIRVIVWESEDVLTVPVTATFRHEQGWAVFVERDGIAVLQPVELGQRSGLQVQLLSGLEAGERLVASPSERIADGTRIQSRI